MGRAQEFSPLTITWDSAEVHFFKITTYSLVRIDHFLSIAYIK